MRRSRFALIAFAVLVTSPAQALLGTELGPLLQLVSGQVTEIEKLAENVGVSREQTDLLHRLNRDVDKTVAQIQTLQTLIERAQGLDPRGIRSLSDLNELLRRAKDVQHLLEELLSLKVEIATQAIARSALQSDTSYLMGQEMVATGSRLAQESETAAPGRANQITAAATSAQMLSEGVQLQTMAQMVELQALLLDFQKTQVERELHAEKARRLSFERALTQDAAPRSKGVPRS
ncbi:MAG: hypothetical protein IT285_06720 [Bdellovibrionales bacterium]|nr:hypothetical protein [Bdellovibrionales bacterium]